MILSRDSQPPPKGQETRSQHGQSQNTVRMGFSERHSRARRREGQTPRARWPNHDAQCWNVTDQQENERNTVAHAYHMGLRTWHDASNNMGVGECGVSQSWGLERMSSQRGTHSMLNDTHLRGDVGGSRLRCVREQDSQIDFETSILHSLDIQTSKRRNTPFLLYIQQLSFFL